MSKTKKVVNMLADYSAAPAAARTFAKAAEQEGKLISDYVTERLQRDDPPPTGTFDKMRAAAAEARKGQRADEGRKSRDSRLPHQAQEPVPNACV